jgi:membrane protein implicated in regulation of membrane protease activity
VVSHRGDALHAGLGERGQALGGGDLGEGSVLLDAEAVDRAGGGVLKPPKEGNSMPWFVWLLTAAALGAAEFFTLTLVFGLLAGAALVAGVGIGLLGQLLAFAAAAAAGLFVVRPVALRHMEQQPLTHEGSDALIGKRAEATQEVTATRRRAATTSSGSAGTAARCDYLRAIDQLTVTTLRNVIGSMDLEETLTSREGRTRR